MHDRARRFYVAKSGAARRPNQNPLLPSTASEPNVDLTRQAKAEIADALQTIELTPTVTESVAACLCRYERLRASEFAESQMRETLEAQRLAAATLLLAEVQPRQGRALRKHLPAFIEACDEALRDLPVASRRGRPTNWQAEALGAEVIAILAAAGASLTLGRSTDVTEVLGVVRRWTDIIDGGAPRRRTNMHEFAKDCLAKYRRELPTRASSRSRKAHK